MELFYPSIYKKNIFDINYEKLSKKGIKYLVFDLDNTIGLVDQQEIDSKTKNLFKQLNNSFEIIIISNNTNKKRVKKYADILNCDFIHAAMKPSTKGYKIIIKKYKCKKEEMCMIGDQIVTDIYAGNRFGITTILVDPLGKKDLKVTSINRFIEKRIIKKLEKIKKFKKGEYYE